jgi:hypothetical protein
VTIDGPNTLIHNAGVFDRERPSAAGSLPLTGGTAVHVENRQRRRIVIRRNAA